MKVSKIKKRNFVLHEILASKRSSGAAGKHSSPKDPKKVRKFINSRIKKGNYE